MFTVLKERVIKTNNKKNNNMNKEDLENKLTQLYKEYEFNKKKVMKQYCYENSPYKFGDKFTDHIGTIVIEKILYYLGSDPCCVYLGSNINKDGTKRKDNSKRQAFQSNEKKPNL